MTAMMSTATFAEYQAACRLAETLAAKSEEGLRYEVEYLETTREIRIEIYDRNGEYRGRY